MKSNATDNDTDTVLVRRRRVVVQKKKRGMRAYSESETDVLADLGLTCSPSKARWVLLAVVVLLACAVYSNVTSCGFVFDDEAAVIKNPDVNPAAPLADLLRHDFWGQNIKSKDSHKSFRPFTTLTFKLNRLLFDRTGGPARGPVVGLSGDHIEDGYTQTPSALAPSFHAVNAALHVAACLLVYFVAAEVFRASEAEAFVSTVLFAVHPVHTEAVTGVVGRADLLSAVFGMASYIAFSRAARKCATSYSLLALSMVFTVLAAASKENGMTVPCVLLVHDLVAASGVFPSLYQVFKRSTWTRGSPSRSCETTDKVVAKDGKEEMCHEIIEKITLEDDARAHLRSLTRPQVRAFLVRQAVNLSVLVALLAFRKSVTATMASESHFRYIESPLLLAHGPSYLYSMGRVHTKYMELLVAPIHLSADWSFNQLPLVYNLYFRQIRVYTRKHRHAHKITCSTFD